MSNEKYHYEQGAIHQDHHKEININGNVTAESLKALIGCFFKEEAEDAVFEEEAEPAPEQQEPSTEELNYFAPTKNLQVLLRGAWIKEVRALVSYDEVWTDTFIEALMASEWRDDIARQWTATGQRRKVKQIKGYVLGLLVDAGVLRGSYDSIAAKAGVTDDPRSFSRYMGEGKKQPYAHWVRQYIKDCMG